LKVSTRHFQLYQIEKFENIYCKFQYGMPMSVTVCAQDVYLVNRYVDAVECVTVVLLGQWRASCISSTFHKNDVWVFLV